MIYKFHGMAAVVGLFLFAAGGLFAQAPRNLAFGTEISGTLRAREDHWFSVQSAAAGFVIVETFGDEIDTFLEVYDSDRNFIAEDDDGGEGVNARLEIFAEAGQTYLFKLRCFSNEQSGPYSLKATFDAVPADMERNTDRSRALLLKPWEPVPVFLRAPGESRWYRYDLTSPENFLIVETSGNLNSILTAYDDRGRELGRNEYSGEGINARVLLRHGRGTVYIEVTAYGMGRTTLHTELWRRP